MGDRWWDTLYIGSEFACYMANWENGLFAPYSANIVFSNFELGERVCVCADVGVGHKNCYSLLTV
jgi:hypothetical protein